MNQFSEHIEKITKHIPVTLRFVDVTGGVYSPIHHFDNLKVKTLNDWGDRIVEMTQNFKENLVFVNGEFSHSFLTGKHLELFNQICENNNIDTSDFMQAYDTIFNKLSLYQVDNKDFETIFDYWGSTNNDCTFWVCPDEHPHNFDILKSQCIKQTCPVVVLTKTTMFEDSDWECTKYGDWSFYRNKACGGLDTYEKEDKLTIL